MPDPVILWLRQDLRLHDQPALIAAAHEGPVIPVYVLDDEGPGSWRMGAAQRWWLHHSLASLSEAFEANGSRLILRRGRAAEVLAALLEDTGATRIHGLRHYEPWWRAAEVALAATLCLHDGNHLAPLETVTTGAGKPFRVYSSFWKALQGYLPPPDPEPVPRHIAAPPHWPASDNLDEWQLLPTTPEWSSRFDEDWKPGEDDALAKAKSFADRVCDYEAHRNLPAEEGTSRLSPHLHYGEISPRTLWREVDRHRDATKFRKELAWRDFTSGVLLALPNYADENGRPAYDAMAWRTGKTADADLKAWQQGNTGYPIVDAGMRQLWTTGWMHNRLRMITASFLVKHLLIDWRKGERWFWDCLDRCRLWQQQR